MYSVGEKIVYPMHGAGVIESIEQRKNGEEVVEYYKVSIINGNISLMVQVNNASNVNIRPVISKKEAQSVINNFGKDTDDADIPWNKRYKYNVDKLRSGDILQVSSVLSELIKRKNTCGLSTSDRKMFVLTKNIFCSELSASLDADSEEIYNAILEKII